MKLILENWRKFSESQNTSSRNHNRRRVLNEISDLHAEEIHDWFGGDFGKLSFDSMFDGKLRYSYPLRTEDQRYLAKVAEYLRREGWQVPEDPEDARWQSRRFKVKTVKQKLRKLETGEEYEVEAEVPDLKLERTIERRIPKGPRAGEYIEQKESVNFAKAMSKSGVPEDLMQWWERAQGTYIKNRNWKAIENAINSEKSAEGEDLSVIVSRHPIDVLRMSDIGNITSCHSEGNSYFRCAAAEAKGHGPIAYLVKSEDLRELLRIKSPEEDIYGVDQDIAGEEGSEDKYHEDISALDDGEIFRDSQRGIKGIVAQARVRLRRFGITGVGSEGYISGAATEVAVPETSLYGNWPAGFYNAVAKDAWERQEDGFKGKDGKYRFPAQGTLTLTGGSYTDTNNLGSLLNKFFSFSGQQVDKYGHSIGREHGEEQEDQWQMWEEEIEEHNDRANNELENSWFQADLEDFDMNQYYVAASGGTTLTIPLSWSGAKDVGMATQGQIVSTDADGNEVFELDTKLKPLHLRGYGSEVSAFQSDIRDLLPYYPEDIDYSVNSSGDPQNPWEFEVQAYWRCEDCNNPDDAGHFLDWIRDDIDKEHNKFKELIRRYLVDQEYMRPSAFDNLVEEERSRHEANKNLSFQERDTRFKNFTVEGYGEEPPTEGASWKDDGDAELHFRLLAQDSHTNNWSRSGIKLPEIFAKDKLYDVTPVYNRKALQRAGLGTSLPDDGYVTDYAPIHASGLAEREINARLIKLEKDAYEMISRQLRLDLGDGWEPEVFSGVADTNRATYKFSIIAPGKDEVSQQYDIVYSMVIKITSMDSEDEIDAIFKYIKFLDDNVDDIRKAVHNAINEIVEYKLTGMKKAEQEFVDGTMAKDLISRIYRSNAGIAGDSPAAAGRVRIAKWVADNWHTMDANEKRVAISHYLVPIDNRSLSDPDPGSNLTMPASGERPPTPPHFSGYLPVDHRQWPGTDYHEVEMPSWTPEQDIDQGRGLGRMFEQNQKKGKLIKMKFRRKLLK